MIICIKRPKIPYTQHEFLALNVYHRFLIKSDAKIYIVLLRLNILSIISLNNHYLYSRHYQLHQN